MLQRLTRLTNYNPKSFDRIILNSYQKYLIRKHLPGSIYSYQVAMDPRYINHGLLKAGSFLIEDHQYQSRELIDLY